jgi:hypothetical protein
MTLKTDDRCRLTSQDLFKPNTPYDVQVGADGHIIVRELTPPEPKLVRARKVNGNWMCAEGVKMTDEELIASLREDRESR